MAKKKSGSGHGNKTEKGKGRGRTRSGKHQGKELGLKRLSLWTGHRHVTLFVPTIEDDKENERLWWAYQYRIRMEQYKKTAKEAMRAERRRIDSREETETIAWLVAAAGDLKQHQRSISIERRSRESTEP